MGTQIPAWYFGEGDNDYVVAKTLEEAIVKATEKAGRDIAEADLNRMKT